MILSMFARGAATAAIVAATLLPASAAEPVTFMIDWLPAGDKAAVYLAAEKGLFTAEGLDVTIQSGRGSSDVVTKLATGAADMGTGGLAALLQAKAESEVAVKAVMSVYTMPPDAIFTTEGSGIEKLPDVVGKKIGTPTFSSSNVTWPLLLTGNGIDPAAVELLKTDPGALAPMLATGQVEGTINWITVAPAFQGPLAETGKKLKVVLWSDYGYEGYGLSVLASEKMITERPETVRKMVKALLAADAMAIADPQAAAAALKARVPEIDTDIAAAQYAASIALIDNEISLASGRGAFDKALLATTWDWTAKSQNLPLDKLDPETAVDRSFLPK